MSWTEKRKFRMTVFSPQKNEIKLRKIFRFSGKKQKNQKSQTPYSNQSQIPESKIVDKQGSKITTIARYSLQAAWCTLLARKLKAPLLND